MTEFYQIRMKFNSSRKDIAEDVWETGHIGIWFGGWLPNEFQESCRLPLPERLQFLNGINHERGVNWNFEKDHELAVPRRFFNLKEDDWICSCFGGSIHLGHVSGPVERGGQEFDQDHQIFKWRKITKLKSFIISDLPDPYRLVPAGAQGTLFRMHAYEPMMRILERSNGEREVCGYMANLSLDEWLNFLGPKGWESLCEGFLILEHEFVPTGLVTGGTLKDFDMIGTNWKTGEKIYGQCKKGREPILPPPGFLDASENLFNSARVFLFAYGGCQNCPSGVTAITGDCLKKWFEESEKGKRYRSLIDRPHFGESYGSIA